MDAFCSWEPHSAAELCILSGAGLSLQELGIYGKLRKVQNCGPVSMFRALLVEWKVGADLQRCSVQHVCLVAPCSGSAQLAAVLCISLAARRCRPLRWQASSSEAA